MRYVILNEAQLVVNVVEWDGVSAWAPPPEHTVVPHETAAIGEDLTPSEDSPQ